MPVAVKINGHLFRSTLYLHTVSGNRGVYMDKGILGRVSAKLGDLAHFEIRWLADHEAASQVSLKIEVPLNIQNNYYSLHEKGEDTKHHNCQTYIYIYIYILMICDLQYS